MGKKPKPAPGVTDEWRELWRNIPGYDPELLAADCHFDPQEAEDHLWFFGEYLSFSAGKRFGHKFVLEPWQRAIISCLFGWKKPDLTRRYTEAFIFIARKNGKTELAGGLVTDFLFTDPERGCEYVSAALDQEQAAKTYKAAKQMVTNDGRLRIHAKIRDSDKRIEVPERRVDYAALTAGAGSKHGGNVKFGILDELHVYPNRQMYDVIRQGTSAREDPLIVGITTADHKRESICNDRKKYAEKVRSGEVEDSEFFPALWEAPEGAEVDDPAAWRAGNPNLGVSKSLRYMERMAKEAKESPTFENEFRRFDLNQTTESLTRWISTDVWMRNKGERSAKELRADLEGRPCLMGLDLGATDDLCSATLIFPEDGWAVLPFMWAPVKSVKKAMDRAMVSYQAWADAGYLTLTEGEASDHGLIEEEIVGLHKRYQVMEVAADPWNAVTLSQNLIKRGCNVVLFQNKMANLSPAVKHLEVGLLQGDWRHGSHPVLNWMVSNCKVYEDPNGNKKLVKDEDHGKIDAVIAWVMALGRWLTTHDEAESATVDEGVLWLP